MEPLQLDFEQLKQQVITQLDKNRFGVLATSQDDLVTARTMLFFNRGLNISFFTAIYNRKFKQLSENKNVSIAIGNLQIDGIAIFKGKTCDAENEWFFQAYQQAFPEGYLQYQEARCRKNTIYRLIEVVPQRIAVYNIADVHIDVLYPVEQSALQHTFKIGESYPVDY